MVCPPLAEDMVNQVCMVEGGRFEKPPLVIDQLCGMLPLNYCGFPVTGEYLSAFRAINIMNSWDQGRMRDFNPTLYF